LALIGLFSKTLINSGVGHYFMAPWAIGSVIFAFEFVRRELKVDSFYKRMDHSSSYRSIVTSIFIMTPLITYCAFVKGVPIILHHFTSIPGTTSVVVVSKIKPYSSHSSWKVGMINVDYSGVFLNDYIHGLSEDLWGQLNPGDTIVLRGHVSQVGVSYDRVMMNTPR
jgi:hypothetical protein